MNDRHVIVGAGPVGRHVAELLAARGSDVTVVTRSGTSTGLEGVNHQAADASNADQLSALADGASVLYNCANPADYTTWNTLWPPLAASFLAAAERSGAVLSLTGNLYPYGPIDGAMVETTADAATDGKGILRAKMWADAKAGTDAGRLRAVEVRGSDFAGSGVGDNGHLSRQVPTVVKGKRAWVIGSPDMPHSFTDVLDMARMLIAAAEDESAHGKIWHAPTNPPRTQREAITDVLAAIGKPAAPVSGLPSGVIRVAGVFSPLMREISEISYQWTKPYVLDDSASRSHFGLEPTPWDEVCRRTAEGN